VEKKFMGKEKKPEKFSEKKKTIYRSWEPKRDTWAGPYGNEYNRRSCA
jgi:hypothetical protein